LTAFQLGKTTVIEIGNSLLDDSIDNVVVEACRCGCLEIMLSKCDDKAAFRTFARKLTRHDSWRVRIEAIQAIARWVNNHSITDLEVPATSALISIAANILQLSLTTDSEYTVKRVICEALAGSTAMLPHIQVEAIEEVISSMDAKVDTETRLCLAKTRLNLFRYSKNSPALFDGLVVWMQQEHNAEVHRLLTDTIFNAKFLKELADNQTRVDCVREMYNAMTIVYDRGGGGTNPNRNLNSEKAVDVRCWRSLVLVLERTSSIIALLPAPVSNELFSVGSGMAFLEYCLVHPCAAVGQVCARVAIRQVLEGISAQHLQQTNRWIETALLSTISRIALVWSSPTVLCNIIFACETVLLWLMETANHSSVFTRAITVEVVYKGLKYRTPPVRQKASALAGTIAKALVGSSKAITPVSIEENLLHSLEQHLKRALEAETDPTAKREMDKAVVALATMNEEGG
jgi:hypothetical protein